MSDSFDKAWNIAKDDRDDCSYCGVSPEEVGIHHTACEGECDKVICDSCRMRTLGKEWMIVDEEPDNDDSELGDCCRECFDAGLHELGRLTPLEPTEGLFFEVGDEGP